MLPRRLPNFGKPNNFAFLTIKLSYFSKHVWINYGKINNFGRLVQFVACYDGTIIFYPVHHDANFTIISMKTSNVSGVFSSDSYDSFLWSGYWQQFEEMASARQSSSIASGGSNPGGGGTRYISGWGGAARPLIP